MSKIGGPKSALRTLFKTKRANFFENTTNELLKVDETKRGVILSRVLSENLMQLDMTKKLWLAVYHPIIHEIKCMGTIRALSSLQYKLCLPCIEDDTIKTLKFREFLNEDELITGKWNIKQPKPLAQAVDPDIVIVPLLAFDDNLYRLGYGKGYYDGTITTLRAKKLIMTVGLAYEFQKYETNLPRDDHDVSLDFIITEESVYSKTSRKT